MKKFSISKEIQETHNKIAYEWAGGIKNGILHNQGWSRRNVDRIWKKIIENYLHKNPSDSIILDGGCGNGQWIEYLGNIWGFKQIVGIDFSEKMLKAAKIRIGNTLNVKWIQSSLED